ncbi:MAG TPA: glycosyltransferase [Candidatus Saccharimonadales bacterium]
MSRKVMFVTPYFAPKIGGLENYALQLAKQLQANGDDVVVVTTNHDSKGTKHETVEGLRVVRLPILGRISNTPFHPMWYFQLKRLIRAEQPDLINAHAPVPGLADVAVRAAGKIPTVVTYHAATLRKKGSTAMGLLTRATEAVQKRTFRRATKVIAVSEYVKEQLPKIAQAKAAVVYNAIDPADIPADKPKRHSKRLVFVGSLDRSHSWKGLDELLEAVRLSKRGEPKVELHVLGDGNARTRYEARVAELGLEKNVTFHGFVEGGAKYKLIQSAALLVAYPTTANDAFPTVLPEAWACKTPVLGANIGALGTLIRDGVDGLLTAPGKPRTLAKAITKALRSSSLSKLGEAGYERVQETLTWETSARKTDALFAQAMARPVAYAANFAIDNSLAPSIHVYEVCQNLQAQGRDVTLFAPLLAQQADTAFGFRRVRMSTMLKSIAPIIYQAKLFAALYAFSRARRNGILYVRQEPFMIAPTLISKLRRLPLFVETNGVIEEETLADARLPLRGLWKRVRIFRIIEGAAYNQAQHIFTVTDGLKRHLMRKYRLPRNKITVVENGVNTSTLRPMQINRSTDELRIGFVGHLTSWEGMAYAVTAMKQIVRQLPNAKMIIAGDGEQLPELQKMAASLGLERNVEFLGSIDHSQVPAFLNSCDVCLAYYTKERAGLNSPFKVYEYLACGRAVVVSDIAGLSDHFKGVVVAAKPENSADLAKKLIALLNNKTRRDELGAAGLAYIRAGHTWQSVAASINGQLDKFTAVRSHKRSTNLPGWVLALLGGSLLTQFVLQSTPLAVGLHLLNFGLLFGTLVAAQLKRSRGFRLMEWLGLSVGLSLLGLLGLGWALNTVGIIAGWHTLSAGPVVVVFYAAEIVLLARAWARGAVLPRVIVPTLSRHWRIAVPLAFPPLAAFGAERLNNHAGGALAIGTLIIMLVWQIYLVALRRRPTGGEIAASLWGISAGLLLSVSLRSNHLIGYDIHQEFQVFTATLQQGIWQANAIHNTYNACLSITVLPTVLAHLLHVPAEYVFKLAMQLFAAVVPLLVYKVTRGFKAASPKAAFVAALFFALQFQFVLQFPALIRQEIAFVFFCLIFAVAAIDALPVRTRKLLIVAFGMGMVVSHYSTSIVGLSMLAAAALTVYAAPKVWPRLRGRAGQGTLGIVLRPAVIGSLLLFGVIWYAPLTNAPTVLAYKASTALHHLSRASELLHSSERSTFVTNTFSFTHKGSGDFSIATLQQQNLAPDAYSQHIYQQYPTIPVKERGATATSTAGKGLLAASRLAVPLLVKLVFLVGVGVLVLRAWRGDLSIELGALAAAGAVMLLTLTAVPFLSDKYNLDRLYQQLLVVLAVAPVLGTQALLRKKSSWAWPAIVALVLAYGASTTGLVNQLGFGAGDINLSNNNETYNRYYTNDADISAVNWLQSHKNPNAVVNYDRYTRLNAYAYSTMSTDKAIPSILPGRVTPGGYAFRSSVNTETGTAYNKYNDTAAGFAYPAGFLDNYKSTIYSGGGTVIYK